MKIALLGSRGIPARYSGFETFYEQLAVRLAQRGHAVTVYNRAHVVRDVHGSYQGVRLVTLPAIATKHLDTITHTCLSSLHALGSGYDICYYCIVGNSPLAWLPRLRGSVTLINVDGEDWAREKWSGFARTYQKLCERIACWSARTVIADSQAIVRRYRRLYRHETVFVPYGANIRHSDETTALGAWGLEPNQYLLYVGRLVPENCIELLIAAFRQLQTDKKLVIVGGSAYTDDYRAQLRALAGGDPRIVFTGAVFGEAYAQLSSHAYLYIQPSAIDGTRPALLDQMGFGNCVLVREGAANREVVGEVGCVFAADQLTMHLDRLIADPSLVDHYRACVRQRIETYYNWEWITSFYEELFARLRSGRPALSYDRFLKSIT